MQYASKVSACRRELNSHQAAWPHSPAGIEATPRLRGNARQKRREVKASHGSTSHDAGTEVHESRETRYHPGDPKRRRAADAKVFSQLVGPPGRTMARLLKVMRAAASRHGPPQSCARSGISCGAPPGVTGCLGRSAAWAQHTRRCLTLRSTRTHYGRPAWPGQRYAVHFRQPGQAVLP